MRPGRRVDQRLVQVPAAGHDVGEGRAAHEAWRGSPRGAAPAARRCGTGPCCRRRSSASVTSNTASTWLGPSSISSDSSGRPSACAVSLHDAQRLLGEVEPGLGQQVVAGMDQAPPSGGGAGPGGRARDRACGRVVRDAVDVELDLQPAAASRRPAAVEPGQRALQHAARVQFHRRAVLEPGLRAQPAGGRRPGQLAEAVRVGQQQQVVGEAEAAAALAVPPGSNTLNAVRSEVSLSISVLTMPMPSSRRLAQRRSHQRLAARDAMQVAPGEAHQLQPRGIDRAARPVAPPARARRRAAPQRCAKLAVTWFRPRPAAVPAPTACRAQPGRAVALGLRALAATRCAQVPAGAMPSTVSGPCTCAASAASATPGAVPPACTVSIAFSSMRRLAMITLSLVPRCSRVRSWIGPMLSTAHWSCTLMSSSPMPR